MPGFPTKQQAAAEAGSTSKNVRSEMKSKDLILKKRNLKRKKQAHQSYATGKRNQKKGKPGGGGKKKRW